MGKDPLETDSLRPIRILHLDDNPYDRELVRYALEVAHEGFEVQGVSTLDGLDNLDPKDYDLVLTDFNVLGYNGPECVSHIRKLFGDVPIIVVTGTGSEEAAVDALQRGVDDYVIKTPQHIQQLPHRILSVLERRRLVRERRRAAQELRRSYVNFRNVVERNPDAVVVLDLEHRVRFANIVAEALLGRTSEELVGTEWQLPLGLEAPEEIELPDPADGTRYVETRSVPVLWQDQEALLVVMRDITARKQDELRLAHLNRVLRAMGDVNRLIAQETDSKGLAGQVCRVFTESGYYRTVLFVVMDPKERPAVWAQANLDEVAVELDVRLEKEWFPPCWQDAASAEYIRLMEWLPHCADCPLAPIRQKYGDRCLLAALKREETLYGYLLVSLAPDAIVDPDEDELFISLINDLTLALQNMRAREEYTRLQEQLNRAQRLEAIGRLAGGVAHDFNNMLSVILGYTELALSKLQPIDPIYEDLQEVKAAAQRSAELTQHLLAFSRQQPSAPVELDLNEQLRNMDRLLRRLIGEDIQLSYNLDPRPALVYMDPAQVDQIVANLVVNARDAMPHGGRLLIETRHVTLDQDDAQQYIDVEPGEYVLLSVADTGVGMSRDILQHIFEPFFTTKEEGTGLGLSTVYGIVQQNKGGIHVYSEPGKGTTFHIYLPRYRGSKEKARPAEQLSIEQLRGHETILLVEDEDFVRRLAQRVLERMGYRVLEAASPGEALTLCEKYSEPIHLLLTDVIMPLMNGKELYERVAQLKPGIRVLYMSGYPESIIAEQGWVAEGIDFIQKPFRSVEALASKVRQVLDRR